RIKIWKIEKADWNKYQQYLENTKELEGIQEYTKLIQVINKAAELAIPKITNPENPNKQYKGKPWWIENCQSAVDARKYYYGLYMADASAKRIIKQTKRASWRQFCGSLNHNTPMKEVWKKLNIYKNRKQYNKIPLEREVWTDRFHEKLSPFWANTKYTSKGAIHNLDEMTVQGSKAIVGCLAQDLLIC
ncbi:hypothetical protein NQ318_016172, partial [Aromia moschata]